MAITVNTHEAKSKLSKLLAEVERGGEVVIARAGKPVARLVPIAADRTMEPGWAGSGLWMSDDFDELPKSVLAEFEGSGETG